MPRKKPKTRNNRTAQYNQSRAKAGFPTKVTTPGSEIKTWLPNYTREALKGWAFREHKSLQHKCEEILYDAVERMRLERKGREACCPQCRPVPLPSHGMCKCPCHRKAA